MKIQCDVCERAPATVICCADEAALCGKCDLEIHAANKLASKHQRLLLHTLSDKLPKCDICQDKPAFIFCVQDRALFCEDCDQPIHAPNTLAANHQRLLATGIQVALSSSSSKPAHTNNDPPTKPSLPAPAPAASSSSWSVDDLLHFSDFDHSHHKHQKETLELGEFEWLADVGLLGEEALEVPQLQVSPPTTTPNFASNHRPSYKKPRIESPTDDHEFFIVPDLG